MLKYSVGIDVSKAELHFAISVIDANQHVTVKGSAKFDNTKSGIAKADKWIQQHHKQKDIPLVVLMEATGVYYELVAQYLHINGYTLSVILPNKAKKYLQATGLKSKNDSIDAKGLSRMGAEQNHRPWQPMNLFFYQLRDLTRQHQRLSEEKTATSNQLEALQFGMFQTPTVIKMLKKKLRTVTAQIEEMNNAISDHVKQNKEVYEKVIKICKIKGVAIHTVAVILAETNGFALFENSRQLVSYAGYDVVENQSGKRSGKTNISKKGNSRIRRALHMPAFSVVTYMQAPFIQLFNRTLTRHNQKMKSYVAVQKKLLVMIYALWKNNVAYDPKYHSINHTREKEQASSSPAAPVEPVCDNKNSADQKPALHKVDTLSKDRSLPPLRTTKITQKMFVS
ncbi:MAG: IS110 family transposase [Chitinophagaceae bacterium]|nr:MAG: IS110 family transposase [Chitinophagaceae bacterium]